MRRARARSERGWAETRAAILLLLGCLCLCACMHAEDMSSQAGALADYWSGVNQAWSGGSQEAALAAACASYGLGQVFTDFARPLRVRPGA